MAAGLGLRDAWQSPPAASRHGRGSAGGYGRRWGSALLGCWFPLGYGAEMLLRHRTIAEARVGSWPSRSPPWPEVVMVAEPVLPGHRRGAAASAS